MRRLFFGAATGAALLSLAACKRDTILPSENIPTAGVRFINAVPDTAGAYGLDFRFVDIAESNVQFRMTFRNNPVASGGVTASTQTQYKAARAGSRRFVVFLDDTIQSIASVKLKDSVATFEVGNNYTVMLWGGARSGSTLPMRLTVLPENVPDPGAQVALRVINATDQAIDVRTFVEGTTAPTTPTWAAVPPLSASSYVTVAPGRITYNVRAAGATTNLFGDMLALLGAPAASSAGANGKIDTDPLPGTLVAGSAVTLVVYPRSTVGTRAPQTAAFLVPAGAFMWDRRPPRGY